MVQDIDIWRAANLLLKQHGADADLTSTQYGDEMLAKVDLDGRRVWRQTPQAIEKVRRKDRKAQERLN